MIKFMADFDPDRSYIVGKTYEYKKYSLLDLFRFYDDLSSLFEYSHVQSTIVLEVEILGSGIEDNFNNHNFYTNKIRIIREIPKEEYYKYSNDKIKFDKNGNILFIKTPGMYYIARYDSNNNITYLEDEDGETEEIEYDDNSNEISHIKSNGYKEIRKYNEKNELVSVIKNDSELLIY